jgi:hypothetical protein
VSVDQDQTTYSMKHPPKTTNQFTGDPEGDCRPTKIPSTLAFHYHRSNNGEYEGKA